MPHSAVEEHCKMDASKSKESSAMVVKAPSLPTDLEIFKKPVAPAPKVKTMKKNVLDEDTYIQEMEKIIQRDFFPDLEKVTAQLNYLNAVDNNDVQTLRELALKYSSGKRPPTELYASPATFETPLDARRENDIPDGSGETGESSTNTTESTEDKLKEKEKQVTLNEYLSKYTSEDNQSFQEIMEEAEKNHRIKYSWLYEAEDEHEAKRENYLALPSIEDQANQLERPLELDSWAYKGKNFIMYVPDGVALTPNEQVEASKKQKEILYNNTHFLRNPFNEQLNQEMLKEAAQVHAKAKEGRIGVDGKEIVQTDGPPNAFARPGCATMGAVLPPVVKIPPKEAAFDYLRTPSPAPGVAESPLMTWGEIEGTPFRLDGGDTPLPNTPGGPHFKIADVPKREKLAIKLAEKASQRHRDRKNKAMQVARSLLGTPSPRPMSVLDRMTTMSPAARRLASCHLKLQVGTDKALRASYTPSRSTPHPLTPRDKTPSLTPNHTPSRTPGGKESEAKGGASGRRRKIEDPSTLTDNLLQLPKRVRASDFFQ